MGVLDVTAEQAKALTDGLHIYGSNYTKWSKVFVNGTKVPTSFISDKELVISLNDLADGLNNLVVNQMGSSDTIFRSSNVISYLKPVGEAPVSEDAATIEDTVEETPSSIDRAINQEAETGLSNGSSKSLELPVS